VDKIFQNIQIKFKEQGSIQDFFMAYPHVLENTEYGWMKYEKFAYVKFPVYHLEPVSKNELNAVFKKSNAPVLSYTVLNENGNVYWYVCRVISLENLKSAHRRDISKAANYYTIRDIEFNELIEKGFEAYSETRKRVGLSDFQKSDFLNRFSNEKHTKANFYVGAYNGQELEAFLSLIIFNNNVEIEGVFSKDAALPLCVNNYLNFAVTHYFLNEKKMNLVSYGFSSIQEGDFDGLHRFKLKCGFDAIKVQRIFVVNPKYKFLINNVTLSFVKGIVKFFPTNRLARKINGVINILSN
jgi:hypothetical protein